MLTLALRRPDYQSGKEGNIPGATDLGGPDWPQTDCVTGCVVLISQR